MFDRFKKVLLQTATRPDKPLVAGAVSVWAATQGLSYLAGRDGVGDVDGFTLAGKIGNKVWKLQQGCASRNYIHGQELSARAELKLNVDVSVIIINRPLKDTLERHAYEVSTDSLQTTADPSLPEEMRWLALYPEFTWDSLAPEFWMRYAVLAEKREEALAWIDPHLAGLLMDWPEPGPDDHVPFILMIMRGKAYLRMQYTPADVPTLEHATKIFAYACQSGVANLTADILV